MSNNQEIDLNLKHYIGHHSDVIKDVKSKISNYLRNPEVDDVSRSIYSAIYNALTHYQTISDLSISGETADKTFLENMVSEFNKDFKYLDEKYNSKDPTIPKVIEAKGRIKSPISAMEKILEKISEYIHDGMDLKLLNNSLRDFVGLRIIVNPPPEIKAQGKQAEINFCYQVFNDLLTHRGIIRQTTETPANKTDYRFIKVNTVHDPNKLQKMKERPQKEGFKYNPEELGIYIPTERPQYVERYDEYFKDYQMYPKSRLYQRLHICAHPYFANDIPKQFIPNYIIPSKASDTCIEYQVCTIDEEEFAEHGKAAHTEYKGDKKSFSHKNEREFHRLGIPIFMKFDEKSNKIKLSRLDQAMEDFYGYSFKSMFNIDYQDFLNIFDVTQRNQILAGNLIVEFDEEQQDYTLKPATIPVLIDEKQTKDYIQEILTSTSKDNLIKFYENNGILNNMISTSHSSEDILIPKAITLYTLEKPLTKEQELEASTQTATKSNNTSSNQPTTNETVNFTQLSFEEY